MNMVIQAANMAQFRSTFNNFESFQFTQKDPEDYEICVTNFLLLVPS